MRAHFDDPMEGEHGCMDAWKLGSMVAWMHGCMGAWMYVVHAVMQSCSHAFNPSCSHAVMHNSFMQPCPITHKPIT
jgi:hypothetical protein